MTFLTFYGGACQIGGTKILLQDGDTKIFLDFGEDFNRGDEYCYEYLKLENAFGLAGLFEFGLMPRIPRVFSEEALRLTDTKYETPDIDGILISHSHSDHISDIKYVDRKVPIHIGHGTWKIANLYSEIFSTLFKIGEHENVRTFKTGDIVKINDISYEPIHVDHSVPGAYGFIIRTSAGPIIYTGDLRMHGPKKSMTEEFIEKAAKQKPHALLIEGTNMEAGPERSLSEEEVEANVDQIIRNTAGTVFAYFPMTNLDRFMTFYNAARRNRRKMVLNLNLAYYVQNIRNTLQILPDVATDDNLGVYFSPKKSCTFCEQDYRYNYEKAFLPYKVTYRDIQETPRKYLVYMTFTNLIELVYIKPRKASFIYASSEHFYEGEENEEQRAVWERWMEHFGIEFHKAHCSGHASRDELARMIEAINPEILIPVHTSAPEEFRKLHDNVVLPARGETLRL